MVVDLAELGADRLLHVVDAAVERLPDLRERYAELAQAEHPVQAAHVRRRVEAVAGGERATGRTRPISSK
ncbi:hypothetical protein Pflav_024580 [Phytohabitans flavus]|uniref:Uncharacterized protein n=1 Tax=Phytohabitans flavus TaxID=1076124 RepID=A0A6F8XQL8_9ACTN|nr:hypothetical protein Pflav_024580 [Phytohabitans flavus]